MKKALTKSFGVLLQDLTGSKGDLGLTGSLEVFSNQFEFKLELRDI